MLKVTQKGDFLSKTALVQVLIGKTNSICGDGSTDLDWYRFFE